MRTAGLAPADGLRHNAPSRRPETVMTARCRAFLAPLVLLSALMLGACAGYAGHGLVPGVADENAVRATMGEPAMRWPRDGGGAQLAYPRGPAGFHTWMVFIGADGRLERIENALESGHFARIVEGMTEDEVLRTLGPPQPQWTAYFPARDERVWEWRYCDSWNEAARFNVLFDGTTRKVRSTLSWTEGQKSHFSIGCSR